MLPSITAARPSPLRDRHDHGAAHARAKHGKEGVITLKLYLYEGVGGIDQAQIGMQVVLPTQEALNRGQEWPRFGWGIPQSIPRGPSRSEVRHAVDLHLTGKRGATKSMSAVWCR